MKNDAINNNRGSIVNISSLDKGMNQEGEIEKNVVFNEVRSHSIEE
jgi:hypothetical protein